MSDTVALLALLLAAVVTTARGGFARDVRNYCCTQYVHEYPDGKQTVEVKVPEYPQSPCRPTCDTVYVDHEHGNVRTTSNHVPHSEAGGKPMVNFKFPTDDSMLTQRRTVRPFTSKFVADNDQLKSMGTTDQPRDDAFNVDEYLANVNVDNFDKADLAKLSPELRDRVESELSIHLIDVPTRRCPPNHKLTKYNGCRPLWE